MGCASSKHLETVLKAEGLDVYSNSSHQKNNSHQVALTSTTYGILNPDYGEYDKQQQQQQQTGKSFDSSTNQVYEKLKNFELNTESGPQSWSEVSKVLENLKPGLEKKNPMKIADRELETVDALEAAEGAEESNQPAKISFGRKTFFYGSNNISFHTVEELDAKIGRNDEKQIRGKNERPARISYSNEVGSPRKDNLQKNPLARSESLGQSKVPNGRSVMGSGELGSRQASQKNFQRPNLDLGADNDRGNSRFNLGKADFLMEPNSPLFDPELLASFEKALKNLSEDDWNAVKNKGSDEEKSDYHVVSPSATSPLISVAGGKKMVAGKNDNGSPYRVVSPVSPAIQAKRNPLNSFEEKCPPGGEKTVVLYTTTLRGIRKTFEDCNNVRSVLESFGVSIDERDVSMHLEFRNELRELMGKPVPVPRLFIKGRNIGGADEVLQLHEDGKLGEFLKGLSTGMAGKICDGCGGMRFVPCLECSGSCKLVTDENVVVRCPHCNENGLIQCPICC